MSDANLLLNWSFEIFRCLFWNTTWYIYIAVSLGVSTPSPRSQSKKLTSTFRCLSLKKVKEPEDEMEHLQQPERDPYQDLETAYVAQLCMTWETLHSQYTQLNQKISCQPENSMSYSHTAQQFQQFQVLLQRFIENEPFEQGLRPEIYTRTRNSLPKLLQVPKVQGRTSIFDHFMNLLYISFDYIGFLYRFWSENPRRRIRLGCSCSNSDQHNREFNPYFPAIPENWQEKIRQCSKNFC